MARIHEAPGTHRESAWIGFWNELFYNFPTAAMIVDLLRQRFATVKIVPCGRYALAQRCPLLVAETAA